MQIFILFCFFAKKLIAHPHSSFSTPESPRAWPVPNVYANKHENPKIVQRDAGEVRDEVPAKKGPKRLLMKAEPRLLCHAPHLVRNSEINSSDLWSDSGRRFETEPQPCSVWFAQSSADASVLAIGARGTVAAGRLA